MIRKGENYSFVEANLYLPDNSSSIDGNIIVTREVYSNGRNNCKINGRLVTVNELRDFMKTVIDIHGQNENQSLINKQQHIKFLDNFIGEPISYLKIEYHQLFNQYNKIQMDLKSNYGDEKEKQRKLDLLKYQLKEIEEANLQIGEDENLEKENVLILNSKKIYENLSVADNSLSEKAIDAINLAIKSLEKIEELSIEYKEKLLNLKNIYYDVQELARDLSDLNQEDSYSTERKNEIEERLDLIYSLKRKYGNSIIEILKYKEEVKKEINHIENLEQYNNKLKIEISKIEEKMFNLCTELNKIRINNAQVISEKINKELKDLEMKSAKVYVNVKFDPDRNYNINGLNEVEILISTNIGEDIKPLIKIASGGESSRIMLAIKTVLADSDEVPILIFDEIDTGISGKAAKVVGEKIKIISHKHQVLCITHQASIASKGDYNYFISKYSDNNKTVTKIKLLKENEVIEEIARISCGDITKKAIEYAKEIRKAV